jgi:hypothetical protein
VDCYKHVSVGSYTVPTQSERLQEQLHVLVMLSLPAQLSTLSPVTIPRMTLLVNGSTERTRSESFE